MGNGGWPPVQRYRLSSRKRVALYMAALAAVRCNRDFKAFYNRLSAAFGIVMSDPLFVVAQGSAAARPWRRMCQRHCAERAPDSSASRVIGSSNDQLCRGSRLAKSHSKARLWLDCALGKERFEFG